MSIAQVSQTLMPSCIKTSFTAKRSEMLIAMGSLLKTYRHRGLGHVSIFLEEDAVVIQGHISSYYLKQLAQEVLRPVAVGMRIRNELRVH